MNIEKRMIYLGISYIFLFSIIHSKLVSLVIIPNDLFFIFTFIRSSMFFSNIYVAYRIYINHYEQKLVQIIYITYLLVILAYILETISFILLNLVIDDLTFLSKILFDFSQLILTIAPVILLYYIASHFKRRPQFWFFFPIIIDSLLEFILLPLDLTHGILFCIVDGQILKLWYYSTDEFWITGIYYSSIFWLASYTTYLIFNSRKTTLDQSLKTQQNTFLIWIILLFMISPLLFSLHYFITDDYWSFLWVSTFGRTINMLIIMIYFLTSLKSKFNFFQPQALRGIYLVNIIERTIISERHFRKTTNKDLLNLIMVNLEGINSIIGELLESHNNIRLLNLKESSIMINFLMMSNNLVILLHIDYRTDVIDQLFDSMILNCFRYIDITAEEFDKEVSTIFGD